MAADAIEHGREVKVNASVSKMLTKNGRAAGVVLEDGTEYSSFLVVSNPHPKTTYLNLLGENDVSPDLRRHMENFLTRSGTVKINLALSGLSSFTSYPAAEMGPQHTGTIQLQHSIDHVENTFDDSKHGKGSEFPYAEMVIPTCCEQSVSPEGKHIAGIFTQYVPAEWADEDRCSEEEAFADRVIAGFSALAPGFDSLIEHRQVIGTKEMQLENRLIGGHIMQGDLGVDQMSSLRPHPQWCDY